MISLTEEGDTIARSVQEKYDTLSQFFVNLGVDPEKAKEDAHKIEHDISEESFDAFLKFISTCDALTKGAKKRCKNCDEQ
jgi:Mn-dependent DtxR family transcriptional regulator